MNGRMKYRLAAVLLLGAIGAHRVALIHRPASVAGYHERIRNAAASVPRQIGPWIGADDRVSRQTLSVLAPNVIISRHYTNIENGLRAGVLFVHCADAHDMAGHFPLRCYPADGWVRRSSQPRDWQLPGLTISGTQYEFYMQEETVRGGAERRIIVANCLLRPDGKVLRDMDAMAASIVGAGGQSTGSGQVQVFFEGDFPREKMDEAVATLMQGYRPVVDAILAPALP